MSYPSPPRIGVSIPASRTCLTIVPISTGSGRDDQYVRLRIEALDLGDLAREVGVTDLVGQLLDHLATDVVHRVALLEVLRPGTWCSSCRR